MDALETQLLLETSKVKSPDLSAIVGFFHSRAGCLLHKTDRHWNPVLDHRLLESDVGAHRYRRHHGASCSVRLAGHLAHTWAREMNQKGVRTLHGGTELESDSHGLDTGTRERGQKHIRFNLTQRAARLPGKPIVEKPRRSDRRAHMSIVSIECATRRRRAQCGTELIKHRLDQRQLPSTGKIRRQGDEAKRRNLQLLRRSSLECRRDLPPIFRHA